MYMKLSITTCALFLLLASSVTAGSKIFDIIRYGGVPNGDITQAFTNAWKDACASTTPSKLVVPRGTFKMNAVDLKGPCKASIEVKVDGTIQAPQNPDQLNDAYQWVKFEYINSFALSGAGTFDGQGATAWKQNDCGTNQKCKRLSMNFGFNFLNNSIIRGVTSKDSKNFHVNVLGCHNLTFDGFTVSAPAYSINTDGIHIGKSTEIKIINSNIGTGDDCISLGDGIRQITVQNVNCGPGHGISVGSLGKYENEEPLDGFTVKNCTLKSTTNGVRIKTWPGVPGSISVSNIHFEDITMIDVQIPVVIDQEYCPWNQCSKKTPSKIKISKVTFKNIRGTSTSKEAVVLVCSKGVPCEDVEMTNVDLKFKGAPAIARCANVKPIIRGKAPACRA